MCPLHDEAAATPTFRVRKGYWTEEEDIRLRRCIDRYGEGKWHQVPQKAGLNRCRKSCRLRWFNYLKPDINRARFSPDEVDYIIRLHNLLGNRWALIAGRLPGRTPNDIKNYWNTRLRNKHANKPRSTAAKPPKKAAGGETGCTAPPTEIIKPRPWTFAKRKTSPWAVQMRDSNPELQAGNQNLGIMMPEQQHEQEPPSTLFPAPENGSGPNTAWWDWDWEALTEELGQDTVKSDSTCNGSSGAASASASASGPTTGTSHAENLEIGPAAISTDAEALVDRLINGWDDFVNFWDATLGP